MHELRSKADNREREKMEPAAAGNSIAEPSSEEKSLRGPMETPEYLAGPRVVYKEQDLPYYPGLPPAIHSSKAAYPRAQDMKAPDYRYPQYYPPPRPKGPLRQDVPPSPPQHHRVPLYNEVGRRPGPRGPSPDQYQYRTQDPRQKNPMTAAV